MRKSKSTLPFIVMFLAAVLAVLILLPVKSNAGTIQNGFPSAAGSMPACLCGAGSGCYCIWMEEPV